MASLVSRLALLSAALNPFTTVPHASSAIFPLQIPIISSMSTPYTLPPLPYAYNALEPHISAQIMELHHSKHHQTYITNLNAALAAHNPTDIPAHIAAQSAIRFNGGGHINHSLFWANLAPATSAAAQHTAAPQLGKAIEARWGSWTGFETAFTKALLGIQGSGWAWLVKKEGALTIVTTKDQDPVAGDEVPVIGIDMWEHAYYLQYLNGKPKYVENVLRVVNLEVAEGRFLGGRADAFKGLRAAM